ncbi:MAG: hypothetical protein K0Q79_1996 [Flavipsychrobacter sp.]|jgi:hypothetical protein|nr:hypothetical protein [Flavipsychrobacter sp.]
MIRIKLIILVVVVTTFGCKKTKIENPTTVHTRKMAGMHSWVGKTYFRTFDFTLDSVINELNYAFPIQVINDTLIIEGLYNWSLFYKGSSDSLITFYNENQPDYKYTYKVRRIQISYNYYTGKIYYIKDSGYAYGHYHIYISNI